MAMAAAAPVFSSAPPMPNEVAMTISTCQSGARRATRPQDQRPAILQLLDRDAVLGQVCHESGRVGVVAEAVIAVEDDGVDGADPSGHGIHLVQKLHHHDLVGNGHTDPFEAKGSETVDCRGNVSDPQGDVDTIVTGVGKSPIVHDGAQAV